MNYARIIASAIFVVCGAASVAAQPGISVTPDQVNWRAVDDAPGWQHAVLAGDPTKPGPFVERFKDSAERNDAAAHPPQHREYYGACGIVRSCREQHIRQVERKDPAG